MIDIIIVTYNAKNKLKKCLNSIAKHTKSSTYVLTIVDNNSTDGTRQFLEKIKKKATVIQLKKNLGFSCAANLALASTYNDYIALIDDDIEVTPEWLQKLQHHFRKRPKIGLVSGKIVYPDETIFSVGFNPKRMLSIGHGQIDNGQHDKVREWDAVVGPCWLIKRKVYQKIGGFDERFFPSEYEDIDYCLRIREAGYKIICDGKVKIYHHSLSRSEKKIKLNKKIFDIKWEKKLCFYPFKDSSQINKLFEIGHQALSKKQFDKALNYFIKLKKIDRQIVSPYHMALCYQGLGQRKKALLEYKKTIQLYQRSFWKIRKAHYQVICRAFSSLS